MAPSIDIVRHAEGVHNVEGSNEPDPKLTEEGEKQCSLLRQNYPFIDKVKYVIASPLRRTIFTAHESFTLFFEKNAARQIMLLPHLQESSPAPCDTGTSTTELKYEFEELIDTSCLGEKDWTQKQDPASKWSPGAAKLEARAREARQAIRKLACIAAALDKDARIVVVTHGVFLHFLTQDFAGTTELRRFSWRNAAWKSYQFVDLESNDAEARLVETRWSEQHRMKPSWSSYSEQRKEQLLESARLKADMEATQFNMLWQDKNKNK